MAQIELVQLSKVYPGGIEALSRIDLTITDGEFLAIVGPSGSGKSTLLRIIAGLEESGSGSVRIDGRPADGLAPHERDVAMVFQSPALYPHLTVRENLASGLRARRVGAGEVAARVGATAGRLGLTDLLDRRPKALSGGQRQRVVLGRALARRAGIVLLDEPLSHLDTPLRASTRADLIEVHREQGGTMVLVTHDQAEAMAMGDRVAVIAGGRLLQVATPREVYDRPASRLVAAFIGSPAMNTLPCLVATGPDTLSIRLEGREPEACVRVPRPAPWAGPLLARGPGPVLLGIRAEHIAACPAGQDVAHDDGSGDLVIRARVVRVEPLGHETLAALDLGGPIRLTVRLPADSRVAPEDRLDARLDLTRAVWFDAATGCILI